MPFWKGWHSLNRNESRNSNGYGNTSKLYAVMWACGCIKEDKGRGRQTLSGEHTSDPKSEMTFICPQEAATRKFTQLHLKRITGITWSLVPWREGDAKHFQQQWRAQVSQRDLQVTAGFSSLFTVPVICSARERLFFPSLFSDCKIRGIWSTKMLYTVLTVLQ